MHEHDIESVSTKKGTVIIFNPEINSHQPTKGTTKFVFFNENLEQFYAHQINVY